MISFISGLLFLILIGAVLGIFKLSNYANNGDVNFKQVVKTILVVVGSFVVMFFQPMSIQRIDAGNVGLKIDRIGNEKGIPVARQVKGWVLYNNWTTDVVEYSIRQQHVGYSTFSVTTKGGFPLTVQPSFNYALRPEKAVDVYVDLLKGGDLKELEGNFLMTATTISLNNASNKYPIDSIFNNKEGYNIAVAAELNKELAKYFIVTQINPGTVAPPELKQVIVDKTNAVQSAQRAELDRITAIAEAETKTALARGDSAALVIGAKADAEAIKLKQSQLTPEYIEFIKWSNWDGKLPTTSLGGNTSVLLNK